MNVERSLKPLFFVTILALNAAGCANQDWSASEVPMYDSIDDALDATAETHQTGFIGVMIFIGELMDLGYAPRSGDMGPPLDPIEGTMVVDGVPCEIGHDCGMPDGGLIHVYVDEDENGNPFINIREYTEEEKAERERIREEVERWKHLPNDLRGGHGY